MRLHLRGDNLSPSHLRFTVFANGGCCGHLCMTPQEAVHFRRALERGMLDDHASVLEITGPFPMNSETKRMKAEIKIRERSEP